MSGYNQPRRNFYGSNRGRGGSGGGQNNYARNGEATIITVPSRFVGRIIGELCEIWHLGFELLACVGRGGSKVAELQRDTNAKIIITKEEFNGETTVKLIGNDQAIADAKWRIEELTVERERPKRFNDNYEYEKQEVEKPVEEEKFVCQPSRIMTDEEWAKIQTDNVSLLLSLFYSYFI